MRNTLPFGNEWYDEMVGRRGAYGRCARREGFQTAPFALDRTRERWHRQSDWREEKRRKEKKKKKNFILRLFARVREGLHRTLLLTLSFVRSFVYFVRLFVCNCIFAHEFGAEERGHGVGVHKVLHRTERQLIHQELARQAIIIKQIKQSSKHSSNQAALKQIVERRDSSSRERLRKRTEPKRATPRC